MSISVEEITKRFMSSASEVDGNNLAALFRADVGYLLGKLSPDQPVDCKAEEIEKVAMAIAPWMDCKFNEFVKWDLLSDRVKDAYRAQAQAAIVAIGILRIKDYEKVLADHRRLVRELDVALNGDGAALQASLCDIVAQVKANKRESVAPTLNYQEMVKYFEARHGANPKRRPDGCYESKIVSQNFNFFRCGAEYALLRQTDELPPEYHSLNSHEREIYLRGYAHAELDARQKRESVEEARLNRQVNALKDALIRAAERESKLLRKLNLPTEIEGEES